MISLFALLACGRGAAPPAPEVPASTTADGGRVFQLVYSGNMDGEIEPCG